MVKVKLIGTLKEIFGEEEIVLQATRFSELLRMLSKNIPDVMDSRGRPSGSYLFLLNDSDIRVYEGDPELGEEDEVVIIPVSHGG
jgi:molybdopterin converting factor small subunit